MCGVCPSQVSKTHKLKLQMWDTAGQERFASMASLYYRGADAAILVFDATAPSSLDAVKNWVQGIPHSVFHPLISLLSRYGQPPFSFIFDGVNWT